MQYLNVAHGELTVSKCIKDIVFCLIKCRWSYFYVGCDKNYNNLNHPKCLLD